MKTKTKALLLAASAILLVVATVLTTMAFLTDTDEVVNTFTVGNVQITLDEADVDEMGTPLDKEGKAVEKLADAERVKANTYKLLPGHTYTKDPTVTVLANSENCYVRILVTLPKTVDAVFGEENPVDPATIFTTFDATNWTFARADSDDTTRTYEFRYIGGESGVVKTNSEDQKLAPLFTSFTMPGTLTGEDIAKLIPEGEDDFTMDIVAHAIQADGFKDAAAAWASFPTPAAD